MQFPAERTDIREAKHSRNMPHGFTVLFFMVITGITFFGATWKWVAQVPEQFSCTYDTDCITAQDFGCGHVCYSSACVSSDLGRSSSSLSLCNGNIWIGQGTSEWGSAGGWNNNAIPGANDTVYVPSAQTHPIISGTTYSVGTLYVAPGAEVEVSSPASLTITQTLINEGSIVLGNGAAVVCPQNQSWIDSQCQQVTSCSNDADCITDPLLGCAYGCSSSSAGPRFCMARPNGDPSCTAGFVWTGGQSSLWGDVNNWASSSAPGSGDSVVIPTAPRTPYLDQSTQVTDLTIEPGATLEISGSVTLTITHTLVNNGTITLDSQDAHVVCPTDFVWSDGQCISVNCDYDTDCIAQSSIGFGCAYGCNANTQKCAHRPEGDPTCSADLYWTGQGASDWGSVDGWENMSAPSAESTVVIPTSYTACHIYGDVFVKSLTVEPGATLYLVDNAHLTVTQSLANYGSIGTSGGGSVTCPSNQYWGNGRCNAYCHNDADCIQDANFGCGYGCSNSSCATYQSSSVGDSVCAANFVWTGQGASDWSDARPWLHSSPQPLPGATSHVVIPTANADPWLGTSTTIEALTVLPGASLHFAGQNTTLTVTDALVNGGTIDTAYGGHVVCPTSGSWYGQQCITRSCMMDTDCIADSRFGCGYGCSSISSAAMCGQRPQGDGTCSAQAVWTGGGTSSWGNPSGWQNSMVPGESQSVVIPTSQLNPYLDSSKYIGSLTIEPGAALGIGPGATLHISTSLVNNGTINLSETASISCPAGQEWQANTQSCVSRSSSSSSSATTTSSSSSSVALSSSSLSSFVAVPSTVSNVIIGGNRGDMQPAAERAAAIYASQLAQVPPGIPSVRAVTDSLVSRTDVHAADIVTREALDKTLSLLSGEVPSHAAAPANASKPVTRAEAALLVLRAMDIPIKTLRAGATMQQNAVFTAHQYGILRGYDSGALAPNEPVKEAHLSILIHRAALVKARLSNKR